VGFRTSIPATTTDRRLDGSFVNVESARRLSVTKSNQISPQNGTLAELQAFVEEFESLVQLLDVGGDMDERVAIYNVSTSGAVTLKEAGEITVERTFIVNERLIDSYEVPDTEQTAPSGGGGDTPGGGGGSGSPDGPRELPDRDIPFLENLLSDVADDEDEKGSGTKTLEEIQDEITLPDPRDGG
jgi:hypothetical protein